MEPLLDQLKKRRIELALKQHDMWLRVGISRQQYQRLEAKGNPRLDTLSLLAKGLKSEIMLIPQEKLNAVMAILEGVEQADAKATQTPQDEEGNSLADNPWQSLLGDDSE